MVYKQGTNAKIIYSKLSDNPLIKASLVSSGGLKKKHHGLDLAASLISPSSPSDAVRAAIAVSNDLKSKGKPRSKAGNLSPAVYDQYLKYVKQLNDANKTNEDFSGTKRADVSKEGAIGKFVDFLSKPGSRIADILSRPNYAIAGEAKAIKQGKGVSGAFKAAKSGIAGTQKTSWGDPALFNNKWLGLAGDVFLDPTTYLSGGTADVGKIPIWASKFGKGAKATEKAVRSAENLDNIGKAMGQSDLVSKITEKGTTSAARDSHMAIAKAVIKKYADPIKHSTHIGPITEKIWELYNTHIDSMNRAAASLHGGHFKRIKELFTENPEVMKHMTNPKNAEFSHAFLREGTRDHLIKDIIDEITQTHPAIQAANKSPLYDKLMKTLPADVADKLDADLRKYTTNNPKFMESYDAAGNSFRRLEPRIPNKLTIDNEELINLAEKLGGNAKELVTKFMTNSANDSGRVTRDIETAMHKMAEDARKAKELGTYHVLNDIADKMNEMNKVGMEHLDPILKNAQGLNPKMYGLKVFGKMVVPLKESSGKGLTWGNLDKLRKTQQLMGDKPNRAQRLIAATDRYVRPLSSAHAALASVRNRAHAELSNLNTGTVNKLKTAFKGVRFSDDAKALDEILTSGKIMDPELERTFQNSAEQILTQLYEHMHTTGIDEASSTKWKDVFEELNTHLPAKAKLRVEPIISELNKLHKAQITPERVSQILLKSMQGSDLAKEGKTLSQTMLALHHATNMTVQTGAFVDGIKQFGIKTAAPGFRKISPHDWPAKFPDKFRKKLDANNLYYHEQDIPGIIKAVMYSDADQLNKTMDGVREFTRFWKKGKTTYNIPGYYVRNSLSDIISNQMNGAINPKHYIKAARIIKIANQALKDKAFLEDIGASSNIFEQLRKTTKLGPDEVMISAGGKEFTARELATRYMEQGLGSTAVAEDIGMSHKFGRGRVRTALHKGDIKVQTIANNRDNWFRMANYLHSVERAAKNKASGKADNLQEGADMVRKYNFDYADFTPFEQKVADVIPFYRYNRKAVPHMIQNMLEHPSNMPNWLDFQGTISQQLNGDQPPDTITPYYLSGEKFMSPIGTHAGDTQYISIPHPGVDVMKLFNEQNKNPAQALGQNVLSMLNPAIQTGYGLASGGKILDPSKSKYPGLQADLLSQLPTGLRDLIPTTSSIGKTDISPFFGSRGREAATAASGMQLPNTTPFSTRWLEAIFGTQYATANTPAKQRGELTYRSSQLRALVRQIRSGSPSNPATINTQSYPWSYK